MRFTVLLSSLCLAILFLPAAAPQLSEDADDSWDDVAWRWAPLENKERRRCFIGDYSGGMKFTLKRRKVAGTKKRGIRMRSKQDSGFGFVNTGCRLGLDWKINATFLYRKDKGLRDGSTFAGLEIDHPYVEMGTIPTDFIFVGATWHKDGISTFVNDSGTTAGTQASYPGSDSVDMEIRFLVDTEYTIRTRATGTLPWDVIWTGDPSMDLGDEAGLGFGLNNVDKKGSVFLCGLEGEGDLFTGLKKAYLDDLQKVIDHLTTALDDPELWVKEIALEGAIAELDTIRDRIYEDFILGEIDIDFDAAMKAIKKAIKNAWKAEKKVDGDKRVQSWGSKERKRVEKALSKTKELIELVQKMRVTD